MSGVMMNEEILAFIVESERNHIKFLSKISHSLIDLHKQLEDCEFKEMLRKIGLNVSLYGLIHEVEMDKFIKERESMPLVKGKAAKSKKGFSENIKREMEAGKPQKQAVAIAYSEARRGKKPMKKKS